MKTRLVAISIMLSCPSAFAESEFPKPGFIFGPYQIISANNLELKLNMRSKIGFNEIAKNFFRYKPYLSTDCDGICLIFESSGGPTLQAYFNDLDALHTFTSYNNSKDVKGTKIGDVLNKVVGNSATCVIEESVSCRSPNIAGLSYFIDTNDKCDLKEVGKNGPRTIYSVPSCLKIVGFKMEAPPAQTR